MPSCQKGGQPASGENQRCGKAQFLHVISIIVWLGAVNRVKFSPALHLITNRIYKGHLRNELQVLLSARHVDHTAVVEAITSQDPYTVVSGMRAQL